MDVDDEEEDATGTVAVDGGPAKLFWAAAKCDRALDEDDDVVRLKSWGDPNPLMSGTPAYLQLLGVGTAPPFSQSIDQFKKLSLQLDANCGIT